MSNNNMSGFIKGLLVGGVLGVLFAPKEGRQTRAMLQQRASDFATSMKEDTRNTIKDAQEKAEKIKKGLEEELKVKVDDAKTIAEEKVNSTTKKANQRDSKRGRK